MRFSENRIEQLTCSDGVMRDIHIWEPEKPRAVFMTVHGAMDYGGNYFPAALFFKEKGIAVAAHDQHGHDGRRIAHIPSFGVLLDDLDLLLDWVKEEYAGLPVFILSHSMGGLVSTLYGLTRMNPDPMIRGFITSAPYYCNAVKVPFFMKKMAGVLSMVVPRMKAPVEDITSLLTHDQEIYNRHLKDQQDNIKASGLTSRFAHEILKAQNQIPVLISQWEHPMLVIIAGQDQIIDVEATRRLLKCINSKLYWEHYYPENYHENFNELNRDEVFAKILEWVEDRI
jgi:alpha-beta hydrolase superfamily lysophospholipase